MLTKLGLLSATIAVVLVSILSLVCWSDHKFFEEDRYKNSMYFYVGILIFCMCSSLVVAYKEEKSPLVE